MAKNIIRLTESDLHKIVKESVQRILKEEDAGDHMDARESCARKYREQENSFYQKLTNAGYKIVGGGVSSGARYGTIEIAIGVPKENAESMLKNLNIFMSQRGWQGGEPHHDDGAYLYVKYVVGVNYPSEIYFRT